MMRIRGQMGKGNTQEKDDLNAPLPSPTASINPSTESDTTCVDAASMQTADPVIIEDATVFPAVEVISSIPVILDPNTATNQQGRMETDPAPIFLGIESSQPPDLANTHSSFTTPVQSRNKRLRAHNIGSRESSPEKQRREVLETIEVFPAVSRRLTALESEYKKLLGQVLESMESTKKLTDSVAQKDADIVSLRNENEALKEQIATLDSQANAYLAEAEQAKKALNDLTKDLEAERQAAGPRYKASPQLDQREDIEAVSRRLTALASECKELQDVVQELKESNKKSTDSAAQKDADLVSLRSENEALKFATSEFAAPRAKATNIDITLLPHYKKYYKPKAGEICKKLWSELANGEDIVKMYPREGQDYLAEAEQAKKDLEDATKDSEAKRQAACLRYKDRVLKLLFPLSFQYGYSLAVDEARAQAPDVDITTLPHYKEWYNPKAGEIYKKLLLEFATIFSFYQIKCPTCIVNI